MGPVGVSPGPAGACNMIGADQAKDDLKVVGNDF
jgi:hypothetical protein